MAVILLDFSAVFIPLMKQLCIISGSKEDTTRAIVSWTGIPFLKEHIFLTTQFCYGRLLQLILSHQCRKYSLKTDSI